MSKGIRLLFEVADKSNCALKLDRHQVKEVLKSWQSWISVRDRLPDETDRYLIAYYLFKHKPNVTTAYYDVGWGWELPSMTSPPTHWMPLPEPPEVEDD